MTDIDRLKGFLAHNPGSSTEQIVQGLSMSKKHLLKTAAAANVYQTGRGVKGNPHQYWYGNAPVNAIPFMIGHVRGASWI